MVVAIAIPTIPEISTDAMPILGEMRAPSARKVNRSFPLGSVPNGWNRPYASYVHGPTFSCAPLEFDSRLAFPTEIVRTSRVRVVVFEFVLVGVEDVPVDGGWAHGWCEKRHND